MEHTSIAEGRPRRDTTRSISYNETDLIRNAVSTSSTESEIESEELSEPEEEKPRQLRRTSRIRTATRTTPDETEYSSLESEDESPSEDESDIEEVENVLGKRDAAMEEDGEGGTDVYYVKFAEKSHIHNRWVPKKVLTTIPGGLDALRRFENKANRRGLSHSQSIPSLLTFPDQEVNSIWFEVDRVIDETAGEEDKRYLVKWRGMEYSDCTWEKPEDIKDKRAIDDYERRIQSSNPRKFQSRSKRPGPDDFVPLVDAPVNRDGSPLRSYQVEGVNWLLKCYHNKQNNILADEMGLGKTAQIVTFLSKLPYPPFLIVAPLSTLPHWQKEFNSWTTLNAVVYHGSAASRKQIVDSEFSVVDSKGRPQPHRVQFDVLITNYETLLTDFRTIQNIEWRCLILDEGHRLKNPEGKTYRRLSELTYEHCTLLTGTPVQNSSDELFGLLSFLQSLPDGKFVVDDADSVRRAQELLKPLLLRRKKSDVERGILPKVETVVEVELTRIQKRFYRAFMNEHAPTLLQQITGGSLPALQNLAMQLRKVCNHPYLIPGVEEVVLKERPGVDPIDCMVEASGKLVLVSKLLPRLREKGDKVLIFSQMVKVLDILQEYLAARDFPFERLDGGIPEGERQSAIERFTNSSDSFAFLISTRAGGVGINLTAANTVIIFDSDWNPQNDIQAQARAHRIGQTKEVKVYRLITKGTYEQSMFERASRKLGLDHVLLDGGAFSREKPMSAKEVEGLLRDGVFALLQDDEEADKFCADDIDQILERRAKVYVEDVVSGGNSVFARATFDTSNELSSDKGKNDGPFEGDREDFWAGVLDVNNAGFERRCRKRRFDGRSVAREICDRGFKGGEEEVSVLKRSLQLIGEGSEDCEYCRTLIDMDDLPEPGDIEDMAGKIIERVAFFGRLKEALTICQRADVEWPVVLPAWAGPEAEYALMLNAYHKGWREFGEGIVEGAPTLSHNAIVKRIRSLVEGIISMSHHRSQAISDAAPSSPIHPVDPPQPISTSQPTDSAVSEEQKLQNDKAHSSEEPQIGDVTQVTEDNVSYTEQSNEAIQVEETSENKIEVTTPKSENKTKSPISFMSPKDWAKIHSNVVAGGSAVAVCHALKAVGLPTNPDKSIDWSRVRDASGIAGLTDGAAKEVAEAILNAQVPDGQDEVIIAGTPLSVKDVKKAQQITKNFSKLYSFLRKMGSKTNEIIDNLPLPSGVPSWWDHRHDKALIEAIGQYGLQRVSTWILENPLFLENVPENLREGFEKSAAMEISRGKPMRPADPGQLGFLYSGRFRMARVMTIITSVQKEIKKEKQVGDELNTNLRIIEYGTLVPKRGFETSSVPYPIGFHSERRYKLPGSQEKGKWYQCTIVENNGLPLFRVTEGEKVWEGETPTAVWTSVIETLLAGEERKVSIMGQSLYGLNHPKVLETLSSQEGGDRMRSLKKYFAVETPDQLTFEIHIPLVN